MIAPRKPQNEAERLSSLYRYKLLDTMPEEDYDNITRIASEICNVPMSLISLVDADRLFHKAASGIDIGDAERDLAFCSHTILVPGQIMEIKDSSKDERFHDNPFVTGPPNVAFYAGVPLVNEEGFPMGALCVLDTKPHQLSKEQRETLTALAKQAVTQMELRKKNIELEKQKAELQLLNKELERFAYVAAHDLKSPCNNLNMLSTMIRESYADKLDEDGMLLLGGLESASGSLSGLIDGILRHTKTVNNTEEHKERFSFGDIAGEVKRIVNLPAHFSFTYENEELALYLNKSMLLQILLNLCVNAIKYNDKAEGSLHITAEDRGSHYRFTVSDNGPGIPPSQHEKIFELFSVLGTDNTGNKGNGIGLATVKRLVEKNNGRVTVLSEPGRGTTFLFTISK